MPVLVGPRAHIGPRQHCIVAAAHEVRRRRNTGLLSQAVSDTDMPML